MTTPETEGTQTMIDTYDLYHPDCDTWHTVSPTPFTCEATGETFVVVVDQP